MKHAMLVSCVVVLLGACGGGGSDTTSSPTPTSAAGPTVFSCDQSAALSKAQRINVDLSKPPPAINTAKQVSSESWPVTIDGKIYRLNVRVAMPGTGIPIRGVWIYSHGLSPTMQSAPKEALDYDPNDEEIVTSKGYIAIAVARRGAFGSEGSLYAPDGPAWVAQYQSRQITYSQYDDLSWGYHSASVTAAMDYLAKDTRFASALGAVVLTGFSGGAETLLHTAANSPVFRNASKKALIRGAGRDSAKDTNPESFPGYLESAVRLSNRPGMIPALWYDGAEDQTTSPSKLACVHDFYSWQTPDNRLILIEGVGHGRLSINADVFGALATSYLNARQMPGF